MTTMQPWEKASDWSRTHFSLARLTYFLLISTIMWLKNCGKPCNLVCFFCQCTLEGTCGVLRSISIISLSFFPILSLSFIRFQDKTFKSQYWEAKPLLNFFPWPIELPHSGDYDAVSDLMHNWVAQRPDFKSAVRVVKMVRNTQCYQYLCVSFSGWELLLDLKTKTSTPVDQEGVLRRCIDKFCGKYT